MTASPTWTWAWDFRNFALAARLPEGAGFAHVYPDGYWRISTALGYREPDPCRRPRICMVAAQAEVEKALGDLLGGAA